MTKNNKLYNTQYLKSWSLNANRELYLAEQSVLETSYSLNEDADSIDDELPLTFTTSRSFNNNNNNNINCEEEGSWIDLDTRGVSNVNRESCRITDNDWDSPSMDYPSINDGSLTTMLCEMDVVQQQQHRRRSSNSTTTGTSVTVVNQNNKSSNNNECYSNSKIQITNNKDTTMKTTNFKSAPEVLSSSASLSASVSLTIDRDFAREQRRKERRKYNKRGKNGDFDMSSILFQISCLSIIIASFSFSLGFVLGSKNTSSLRLRYF